MSNRRPFRRGTEEDPLVYLIFTRSLIRSGRAVDALERALAAGVGVVQIREKATDDRDLVEYACRVLKLTRRYEVPLIINDRADLCAAIGADGVHLGQTDMSPTAARRIVGDSAWIGLSTHRVSEVRAADAAVVDYLGFGPIFSTTTKKDAEPTTGISGLAAALEAECPLPIFPIGGIDDIGARAIARIGVRSVAVSSYVLSADDVEDRVRRLLDALRS